jgi:imidazolonepropionase
MKMLPQRSDAYLLCADGVIAAFGPMSECPERADEIIDANGGMVFPSWCDSHTHLVYAAPRAEEFVFRIQGMGYEEIAENGGGILNSARKLEATSAEALLRSARIRLEEVMRMGTGCIEIKSGYGLTTESEIKMLKVIRQLKSESPIPIRATFLGAHALPAAYKQNRKGYIDLVIQDMLPKIAAEGLADYCDVFCDKGFFTPEETDRILRAAAKWGLPARIHANELGYTGGVQVGIANNAISVDHLEYTGEAEIDALLKSKTLPTLLPTCAFFLGIPYAPARRMIDAGLPVVLASDYNPGSSPSGNMPFVVSLACIKMKMLPAEAINAATINGAVALQMENALGTIARGKIAHVFVTYPMESLAQLPYAFGSPVVKQVVLNGKLYYSHPG